MQYRGRYIWLIGASEGIGAALARKLSAEGAHLALSARREERLNAVANVLYGDEHLVLPCDVTDPASVQEAFDHIQNQWGRLDEVIYLAGLYTPASIDAYDAARAVQTIDVNLQGIYRVLGPVLPYFLEQRAGKLVLFGSVAGYGGLPKSCDYGPSKAAMNHLAESLRIDLAEHHIEVQLVSPGFVKTRLTDQNEFEMPCRISPEKAAEYTVKGLKSRRFDIHYPKQFTFFMKALRLLPYPLYFWLVNQL